MKQQIQKHMTEFIKKFPARRDCSNRKKHISTCQGCIDVIVEEDIILNDYITGMLQRVWEDAVKQEKEKWTAYAKRYRANQISKGKCGKCPEKAIVKGYCKYHKEKRNEYSRKYMRKIRSLKQTT